MTFLALKWLLACVRSNVIVQGRGTGERAPAKAAFKWLLVDMNDNMLSQFGWAWKRRGAVATLIWTVRRLQPRKKPTVVTGQVNDLE